MIQEKHTSRWNKYARFELIGGAVCYSAIIYILINFYKLDTLGLQICGGLMLIFLLLLPIFSIKIIKGMSSLAIDGRNNVEMMKEYVKKKRRFVTFQKVNMASGMIFMLLTIPVSAKILNGENLFETMDDKLFIALPFCFLFYFLMMYAVSRANRSVLRNTDKLLEEVTETN